MKIMKNNEESCKNNTYDMKNHESNQKIMYNPYKSCKTMENMKIMEINEIHRKSWEIMRNHEKS